MAKQYPPIATYLISMALFVFGFSLDRLGFEFLAIVTILSTLLTIFLLPLKISLMLVFVFISFQGFFKVISNYHPFIHLGGDIVVLTLLLKFLVFNPPFLQKQKIPNPPLTWIFPIYFLWLFIVYFNPYSLGIIPSIAGSKIYITMFLLYFFGYYLIQSQKEVQQFFILFIVLTLIHTSLTIYQGFIGPSSVTSIHPRYAIQLAKYLDTAFRPFGLTNLPGGPSVYIYTSIPFFLYFIYLGQTKLLSFFYASVLPLVGVALLFCQVRSAIIKAIIAGVIFVATLLTSKIQFSPQKRIRYLIGSIGMAALLYLVVPLYMKASVDSYEDNERAFDRSLSTFDMNAVSNARRGVWDRFIFYIKTVPMGAGYSRVGASAGTFQNYLHADPYFPKNYFFADNLFITLVIEIGIPGLFMILLMLFFIFYKGYQFWRYERRQSLIPLQLAILSSLFAIIIGSYGGEGLIYNPESSFFWLFAGILMRTESKDFRLEELNIS